MFVQRNSAKQVISVLSTQENVFLSSCSFKSFSQDFTLVIIMIQLLELTNSFLGCGPSLQGPQHIDQVQISLKLLTDFLLH